MGWLEERTMECGAALIWRMWEEWKDSLHSLYSWHWEEGKNVELYKNVDEITES